MKENNTKMYRVDMIKEGTRFEMPGLQNIMKNLRLVSTSDCSSLIEGLKRDSENEPWKPFKYHISNSVLVTPATGEEMELSQKEPEAVRADRPALSKRGRGRPKKSKPVFKNLAGIDSEFSVKDLSEKNNLKDYDAHNIIQEAVSLGIVEQVRTQKAGRGKPRKIYKLI